LKTFDEIAHEYASRSADKKSDWYSSAAASYRRGRPEYPREVIANVVSRTGIGLGSRLLEIGSGPGTATQSFAELGCTIDCVEPNPSFVEIVRQRFEDNPNIRVHENTFEAYDHTSEAVDAVFAATSFHWVEKEVAFAKSASFMKPSGYLVLLWNHELQPKEDSGGPISQIYQRFAPELSPIEEESQIVAKLESISEWVRDSEHFASPHFGFVVSSVCYSAQTYIDALQSYSPYLQMGEEARSRLFQALFELVKGDYDDVVNLKYLTGYHIARKAYHLYDRPLSIGQVNLYPKKSEFLKYALLLLQPLLLF
jgi:SAM-dependent methyltransferase